MMLPQLLSPVVSTPVVGRRNSDPPGGGASTAAATLDAPSTETAVVQASSSSCCGPSRTQIRTRARLSVCGGHDDGDGCGRRGRGGETEDLSGSRSSSTRTQLLSQSSSLSASSSSTLMVVNNHHNSRSSSNSSSCRRRRRNNDKDDSPNCGHDSHAQSGSSSCCHGRPSPTPPATTPLASACAVTMDEELDEDGDPVRVANLEFIPGVLGTGTFGQVRLAQRRRCCTLPPPPPLVDGGCSSSSSSRALAVASPQLYHNLAPSPFGSCRKGNHDDHRHDLDSKHRQQHKNQFTATSTTATAVLNHHHHKMQSPSMFKRACVDRPRPRQRSKSAPSGEALFSDDFHNNNNNNNKSNNNNNTTNNNNQEHAMRTPMASIGRAMVRNLSIFGRSASLDESEHRRCSNNNNHNGAEGQKDEECNQKEDLFAVKIFRKSLLVGLLSCEVRLKNQTHFCRCSFIHFFILSFFSLSLFFG